MHGGLKEQRSSRFGLVPELALVLVVGLTWMCGIAVVIACFGGARLADEWIERSHLPTVKVFAEELSALLADVEPAPYVPGKNQELDERILTRFREAQRWNRRFRPYLLSSNGAVILSLDRTPALDRVAVRPIEKILSFEMPRFPIYGDDPHDASHRRAFVAAKVEGAQFEGFLYVVLSSSLGDLLRTVRGQIDVAKRLGPVFILLTLTSCIGFLLVVKYLTARLQRLVQASERLARGDYATAVPVDTEDTLGQLADTFNRMRESILVQDEQLSRREARRRQLLANVAHDMRVPLSVVSGFIELLRTAESRKSNADRGVAVSAIVRNVRREREFLADLDSLAAIEFERTAGPLAPVDLEDCLRDLALTLSAQTAAQGNRLTVEIDPHGDDLQCGLGGFIVEGNRRWIERMLLNLLNNAIRYTPAGGIITARLRRVRGAGGRAEVVVTIEDTGLGIPADSLPKIFDEFYRVDRSPLTDPGGTGLGLSVVRRVVEFHRGRIAVESTEGKGSTFTVTLPQSAVATEVQGEELPTGGSLPAAEQLSEPRALPPLDLREIVRNELREGSIYPREWERRGLTALSAVSLSVSAVCVCLAFGRARGLLWSLLAMLAFYGAVRAGATRRLAILASAACSAVFFFISCRNLVCSVLVAAVVLFVLRRAHRRPEEARLLVWSATGIGLLLATVPWLLGGRYPAAVVPLITVTVVFALYSLGFLTRSFEIWIAGAAPFFLSWAGFMWGTVKYETPAIGLIGGGILGLLLLSIHTQREAKRIEVRLMTFFTAIMTLACFLFAYLIIGIWTQMNQEVALPELSALTDFTTRELERAAFAHSEAGEQRVMENMLLFNSTCTMIRAAKPPQLSSMAGISECQPGSCQPKSFPRYGAELIPIGAQRGQRYFIDIREQVPVVSQRVAGPRGSLIFIGHGYRSRIARELVKLYTGLTMLFMPAAVIVLATVIRYWLKWLITDPLLALQDAADRLRTDPEARLSDPRADEIGTLGRVFNMMAAARDERRQALLAADERRRELIEAILAGFLEPLDQLERRAEDLARLTVLPSGTGSDDTLPRLQSPDVSSVVAEIDRLVQLQSALVDDLFTLSKLENATSIPREDPIAVDELLEELAARLDSDRLRVTLEGESTYFSGDAERLSRALGEYVAALAEDPRGSGPVQATVRADAEMVTISLERRIPIAVRGDAPGIAGFRRGADVFSIGRAIADRILVLHGGSVTRFIDRQGSSAPHRVTIELPRAG